MNHRDTEFTEMMLSTITYTQLRRRLRSVLAGVGESKGQVIVVRRRGKRAVALISEEHRQRLLTLARNVRKNP